MESELVIRSEADGDLETIPEATVAAFKTPASRYLKACAREFSRHCLYSLAQRHAL